MKYSRGAITSPLACLCKSVLKLHIRNKILLSIKWVSYSWINCVTFVFCFFLICIFHNSLWQGISIFLLNLHTKALSAAVNLLPLTLLVYHCILNCWTQKIELPPGPSPGSSLFLHIFNHLLSYSALFRKHSLQKKKVIQCTVAQQQNHVSRDGLKLKPLLLPLNLLQRL